MFSFLRRYQRAIFLVITAIIILSFSFFGTYSTIASGKHENPVWFTTVDGRTIRRMEGAAYLEFLSTSAQRNGQKVNLFNDGFLEKDILSTCIGEAIFSACEEPVLLEYLKNKKESENKYRTYVHPTTPFLSTEHIWTYFAPELKEQFAAYQAYQGTNAKELFKKKMHLFLLESKFPGNYVKQFLMYQQKQAGFIEPDPTLEGRDFSLFGYASAVDWFGEVYMQKVVQTLLSGAELAKKEGVQVSDDEVMASLYKNVQAAAANFGDLAQRPIQEIVDAAVRALAIDFATVKQIWKDVLLFQRAYVKLYDHMAVSSFPFYEQCQEGAQYKTIDTYSLQPCLRVHSIEDVAQLNLWKKATLQKVESPWQVTRAFLPAHEVVSSYPELVQELFSVSLKMVGPEQLEPLIRFKELWHWQGVDTHFSQLAEKFPLLLQKEAKDPQSRMKIIDALPAAYRLEVDAYAKKLFIKDHPEWIDEQLRSQKSQMKSLFIRPQGKSTTLAGISDMRQLSDLLKKASLGQVSEPLCRYTQDGCHFYEITVMDRKPLEIIPLVQLQEEGVLAHLIDTSLEAQYPQLRKQNPKAYMTESGEWKPFSEVRLTLLDQYMAPLWSVLDQMRPKAEKQYPFLCSWKNTQEARFALFNLPLVLENKQKLDKEEDIISLPISASDVIGGSFESIEKAMDSLFNFVKITDTVRRAQVDQMPQLEPLFTSKDIAQAFVYLPQAGTSFVKRTGEGVAPFENDVRSSVYSLGEFLSQSACRQKIEALLQKLPSNTSNNT